MADTIDHAIALARKFRHTLRIVTLEGELLSAGGSMTGGSFKNSSNLLGRQRELSELQASCRKALQDVEETQKAIADNGRLKAQCAGEAARLRETKQEIVLRKNTAQMNMERLLGKKQEIAESSADLVMENRELEFQLKEIRENRRVCPEKKNSWSSSKRSRRHAPNSFPESSLMLSSRRRRRQSFSPAHS